MNQQGDVSHVDIYHKLGTLEGKMDALIARVTEYSEDLRIAFDRIRSLERRQAWTMGACAVMTLVIPVIVQYVSSEFTYRHREPAVEHRLR